MRFDFQSLKLFVAVCEHGSIARVAEAENIAPSALSKRISHLEDMDDSTPRVIHVEQRDARLSGITLQSRDHASPLGICHGRQIVRGAGNVVVGRAEDTLG
jgi:hypothetical protein